MQPEQSLGSRDVAWVGRYALFDELARGGMATVHLARLTGPVGFSKTVAVKKMLGNFAANPQFLRMFLDEARVAGRIQHPNVVSVFDVISEGNAVYLVMEYVDGEPLSGLWGRLHQRGERTSPAVAAHVVRDALYGLHAAHEATNEKGDSLQLVHRDISPQNILVGADGVARVLDFGVAKAAGRLQDTDAGQLKGKVAYMAPEQLLGQPIDRRADIFSAGIVLWEALAGKRLFSAPTPSEAMYRVLEEPVPQLSALVPELPSALVEVVSRATAKRAGERFETALAFARAIESSVELIPNHVVGQWVLEVAGDSLRERRERVRAIEAISIPAEPRVVATSIASSETTSAPFMRGLPDDVTRADAPITVASTVQKGARSSPVLPVLGVALVVAAAAWFLVRRDSPPETSAAPSAASLAAGSTTAAVAVASAPALTPPAATASSVAPAPVASASAAAKTQRATPASRARPSKPAAKATPRPLPPPESLFSRE